MRDDAAEDNNMKTYRKRPDAFVTAVQLDLDTDGFEYRKWGDRQTCKAGDWIVNSGDDTYTVDADSFAATYRPISPGVFHKSAVVYAEPSATAGSIRTKEGVSHYQAGDYVVYNDQALTDGYFVSKERFEAAYEPVDDD